ncbi:TrbC/VirB2 family protein [Candidatus Enterovibrio escicola]|uniref:TrbC/VirB2 family protein n=1 Tax=Candidatus Enterovibrio escicola TaxID=1927127 RepID=UPI001237F8B3|nr:TrbC/VirB2 family protein [Candidatus Enterovibrio escacola]
MNNFLPSLSKNQIYFLFLSMIAFFALAIPEFAYAGGLNKINNFMENIANILRGASIITVTVAVMWAGYKFLFMQANVMEVGKIVIAGLLIGGAAEISRYIVG